MTRLETAPKRILVREVNWLGDAVMTTPALQRLRERFPQAHITLLTHEKLEPLWAHHPGIDSVWSFGVKDTVWSLRGRLASGQFDLALILPNSPRSALESWLARIPQRLGYARPWRNWFLSTPVPSRPGHVKMRKRSAATVRRLIRSSPASETLTERGTRPGGSHPHQIHEYLHLIATLGGNSQPAPPRLEVAPAEVFKSEEALRALILSKEMRSPQRPMVFGVNPGAEYGPAKRWPLSNFAASIQKVSAAIPNSLWLAFGGLRDQSLCEELVRTAGPRIISLAGKSSLRELMALLKLCRLLLTNDSGPMHVAAALGTPVVVPYGSTSPELTGPGLPGETSHMLLRANAPCAPCFRRTCPIDLRCLTGITPDAVAQAILDEVRPR